MKTIVGHIFFIWFAIIFAGFFLLFYPLFLLFLSHKKLYPIANFLRKIWAWVSLLFTFSLPIFQNKNKSLKGPFVLVSNHSSYLDIVTIGLFAPSKVSFMAKAELAKIPLFGIFFKTVDIAVKRESIKNAHQSFIKAKEKINDGFSVVIFPEGTIWQNTPQIKPFKNGAFKLAIENQIPILPITFYNNFKRLPDEKWEYYPGLINFKIHRAIDTNGLNLEQADELKEKIYTIIETELKNKKVL